MFEDIFVWIGKRHHIKVSDDLGLYYWAAKKYFVDNIKDKNLRKTFYSLLWLLNAKNKGKFKQQLHTNEVSILNVLKILTNPAYKRAKAIISVDNFSRERKNK